MVERIGAKKEVKVTLRRMKSIDLKKRCQNSQSSLYLKLQNENNFKNYIQKIETVLKIWRIRNLTLEEKVPIFKHYQFQKLYITRCFTQLNKINKNLSEIIKNKKIKENSN